MDPFKLFARAFNLFPCPACGRGDGNGENDFCPDCLAEFGRIDPERHCRGCGGEMAGVLAVCPLCLQEKKRPWLDALALFRYENRAREMLLRFKSGRHPALARPLGKLGAQAVRRSGWRIDLVVPIPVHFTRLWTRGYNQAELFARVAAEELHLPCADTLAKEFSATKQAKRSRTGRHQGTRHAFSVKNPFRIAGKNILLVDDVFTTGATCDAAARALLKNGARSVRLLVACRTPGLVR
ncbi:MAG: ComF family protein [Victivallaceae bacterium]|nr:ComF family protein [Victivallaceae bacterium]